MGGSLWDEANGLATDGAGGVIVVGAFKTTATFGSASHTRCAQACTGLNSAPLRFVRN